VFKIALASQVANLATWTPSLEQVAGHVPHTFVLQDIESGKSHKMP